MAEFNEDGNIEISPGPRGYSIVSLELSEDGEHFRGVTNQPGYTNWIPLFRGPRGFQGDFGDPGESSLRVDETSGVRIFLWDTRFPGEWMVSGKTGVWTLDDGTTWVRRSMDFVETNATDPSTLPLGFRPAIAGSTGSYTTDDAWPETIPGTQTNPPTKDYGLIGYSAASAQGFPGTAEEYMNMVYRVILPEGGTPGQVLTRTATGSAWVTPPHTGPNPWVAITLGQHWAVQNNEAPAVRYNNGTIEMIGELRWVGPSGAVGVWGTATGGDPGFRHIGNIPPGFAPASHLDTTIRVHRGDPGAGTQNYPVPGRVDINNLGQLYLGAYWFGETLRTIPLESGETMINLANISYPLRNSSPGLGM